MSDRPTRSTGSQPAENPTRSTGFQPVENHGQDGRATPLEDAGMMGMYLLLAALAMLFAASVVGYWTIRSQHQPWPPPGFPVLPRTLWLSTLLIVSASVAIQRALSAARRGQQGAMRRGPGNLVPARHGFSGIANDGLVAGRRPDYRSLRKHGALLEAILRAHRPARRPRAGRAGDAGCRHCPCFRRPLHVRSALGHPLFGRLLAFFGRRLVRAVRRGLSGLRRTDGWHALSLGEGRGGGVFSRCLVHVPFA